MTPGSWPDGSLKWTGHALAASENLADTFHLSADTPTEPTSPVDVTKTSDQITVTTGSFKGMSASLMPDTSLTGLLQAVFNTSGTTVIDSLSLGGSTKAQGGQLVVHVQNGPDEPELEGSRPSVVATTGTIDSVTVEQDGPVRAVIKVRVLRLIAYFIGLC